MNFLKWFLIGLASSISLFFLFSISFYNSFGLTAPIILALVAAFFTLLATLNLQSFNQLFHFDFSEEGPWSLSAIFGPALVFIIGTIAFSIAFSSRLENALESRGIVARATIKDGFSVTENGRRSSVTSYAVTLVFKTKDGEERIFGTEIDEDIYNSLARGLKVDVRYLPEDPGVFKILAGTENVKKFVHVSNRNLNFSDLEKLLNMDPKAGINYLNSISPGWVADEDSLGLSYFNQLKKETIVYATNSIMFQGPELKDARSFIPEDQILSQKTLKKPVTDPSSIVEYQAFELKKYLVKYVHEVSLQDMSHPKNGIFIMRK